MRPVLAADPCDLLDPVRPVDKARFIALAKDYDGQNGLATDQSRCEARLALTLENHGVLSPEVIRPPWGEAQDGDGQVWDFKSPHSRTAIVHRIATKAALSGRPAPLMPNARYVGEFDQNTEVLRALAQQRLGKGVVFDLRRLSIGEARSLMAALRAEAGLDQDLVRFFPTDDMLDTIEKQDPSAR